MPPALPPPGLLWALPQGGEVSSWQLPAPPVASPALALTPIVCHGDMLALVSKGTQPWVFGHAGAPGLGQWKCTPESDRTPGSGLCLYSLPHLLGHTCLEQTPVQGWLLVLLPEFLSSLRVSVTTGSREVHGLPEQGQRAGLRPQRPRRAEKAGRERVRAVPGGRAPGDPGPLPWKP